MWYLIGAALGIIVGVAILALSGKSRCRLRRRNFLAVNTSTHDDAASPGIIYGTNTGSGNEAHPPVHSHSSFHGGHHTADGGMFGGHDAGSFGGQDGGGSTDGGGGASDGGGGASDGGGGGF